jgi:hypothetical protein
VYAKYEVRASDFLNKEQPLDWQEFTLEFIAKDPLEAVELTGLNPSSNFTISLAYILVEQLVLSPDLNYELFSVQRGLYVGAGQIVSETSSRSSEVALSRKGVDSGILVYGPYITLPSGNFTAVVRVKTNETSEGVSVRLEVVSQPDAHILSQRLLDFLDIRDDMWFNVTLPFSLKVSTANIEFRVTSNGMTNLYVDVVTVIFQ